MYYCDQLGEKIGENSRKVFTSLWISDSKKRDQKFSRKINDLKQKKTEVLMNNIGRRNGLVIMYLLEALEILGKKSFQ